ncbi:hypothetical protein PsYK624_149870 [Phanerochaete sordida]|uniref:Uncharacterized protein n=1 Tax=Phanerochaete sordida TaxID=48140 RepID=A0A9P3GPF9_9APHY|nr:hypothetical protein PsYK624_149870 [Phanerochaete sordida]
MTVATKATLLQLVVRRAKRFGRNEPPERLATTPSRDDILQPYAEDESSPTRGPVSPMLAADDTSTSSCICGTTFVCSNSTVNIRPAADQSAVQRAMDLDSRRMHPAATLSGEICFALLQDPTSCAQQSMPAA